MAFGELTGRPIRIVKFEQIIALEPSYKVLVFNNHRNSSRFGQIHVITIPQRLLAKEANTWEVEKIKAVLTEQELEALYPELRFQTFVNPTPLQ